MNKTWKAKVPPKVFRLLEMYKLGGGLLFYRDIWSHPGKMKLNSLEETNTGSIKLQQEVSPVTLCCFAH